MNSTLYNGYSGIKTHQFGLDSTSNNIANINTTGYRANMPEFKSLFASALGTANPASPVKSDMNYGATRASNAISNNDGSYKESDEEFSVAYAGKGWFVVGDNEGIAFNGEGAKKGVYFTRDGSFSRDAEGYVVNSAGYYMLGVDLGKIKDGVFISDSANDEENLATGEIKPLQIPQNLHYGPTESTFVNLALNLNANKAELNSYSFFLDDNGEFNEEKLMNTDIGALVIGNENFNANAYNSGVISITKDGETKDFTFNYGDFYTFGELKEAILEQSGLELDFARNADGKIDKGLVLELKTSGQDLEKISVGGKLFERLGMKGEQNLEVANFGFLSDKLEIANYKTTTEIFNDNGDKMLIISRFILRDNSGDGQVWSVDSGIYTKDDETLVGEKIEHNITFDSAGKASGEPITLTYGDKSVEYSITGSNKRESSNVAYMDSSVLDSAKDGTQKGELAHIGIDNDGIINLSFSNGITEKMGRVGVVAFVNDKGLQKVGGNLFEMSSYLKDGEDTLPASGAPLIGWDEKGKLRFGQILHKYLETSNVNPADAMTDLIVYQRGYSMSAKAFTTGDDLIKEAINLKR